MNLSKRCILALMTFAFFQIQALAHAHDERSSHRSQNKHYDDTETERVWKSDRLAVSWFGHTYRVRLAREGVLADRVVLKAGKHSSLEVRTITVTYLNRDHHRRQNLRFYPHERIHNGDRIEFKFPGIHRIISIKVFVSGWSGSRSRDGFRLILKKAVHRPPTGWKQTGYFYGQCIGGHHCPGYRRHHHKKFSIDLKDEMEIQRIVFYAHDGVGRTNIAKVNIYVDDHSVAENIDIKRRGAYHTINLDRVFGRHITFEETGNDEAVIQRITVNYSAYWDRSHRKRKHREHPRRHEKDHRSHRRFSP